MKKYLYILIIISSLLLAGYFFRSQDQPVSKVTPSSVPVDPAMVHSFTVTDERTFLENMIPHHEEAIQTSELILKNTTDPELKKFTQEVVNAQAREVESMKSHLKQWYQVDYVSNNSYQPMMGDLTQYSGKAREKMYVEGMIRHHKGAIEMSKKVLTLNPRSEVKKLAEDILSTQEAEVKTLEGWLQIKYKDVDAVDPDSHDIQVH